MPLAAHAGDRPVSNLTPTVRGLTHNLTHDVVNFLGFGADQANNPTDPQPVAENPVLERSVLDRPRAEIMPHEFAPMAVADAAPPRLPVVDAAAPSVENPAAPAVLRGIRPYALRPCGVR